MKKNHPEEALIAATVAASATEDETDTETTPAAREKVQPPYLAPQPQPQTQLTPVVPQTAQTAQIIAPQQHPQVIAAAAAQPVQLPFQPQQPPPMYTQVMTADGQVLLVPMDNLYAAAAQPQQQPQPLYIENLQPTPTFNIQPAYETIEVLPAPPHQLPVVVQHQVVNSSSNRNSKPISPVEVIDISDDEDVDDPAPLQKELTSPLEIAMREITGLAVKVELADDESAKKSPSTRPSKSKSDMGTNTEASTKLIKREKCRESTNVDIIPDVDDNNAQTSAITSTCELDQTSATPELLETSETCESGGEPLEGEDGDDEKGRRFKGEEIVDKSADLKRVGDDDDHHSKSSPGGLLLQIATGGASAAATEEASPGKEEFRCERCGKVYIYPNFLKVHQRRPCAAANAQR